MSTLANKKQLFQLTWPIFFEAVLFSVIGSVDVMMLSNYADNAVGGVGAVNQVLSLFAVVSPPTADCGKDLSKLRPRRVWDYLFRR